MDGCLEQGRDANNNGVAFSLTTVMYIGLATVADSLTAIRRRVYTDKLAARCTCTSTPATPRPPPAPSFPS